MLRTERIDQVWVFAVARDEQVVSDLDAVAIAEWHERSPGNLIVDTRSFGVLFDYDADLPFLENEVAAFCECAGHGLWIGIDDSPSWVVNGNVILSALGYEEVLGRQILPSRMTDAGNLDPLLARPNTIALDDMHLLGSPGIAPVGVQPDGIDLRPLIVDDGTGEVMTSFALQGGVCGRGEARSAASGRPSGAGY